MITVTEQAVAKIQDIMAEESKSQSQTACVCAGRRMLGYAIWVYSRRNTE
jgi:hypothetical protein